MRLELAASEFVTLRYNQPTLQYNTSLIAYTVFYLHNRKYPENCEIKRVVSSETNSTVKCIHQYGVNFHELYYLIYSNYAWEERSYPCILRYKIIFFHCTALMEKWAGAKTNNSEIRKSFCLAAENLLHEKKNLLSEFIYCMSHQTYTKDALVLCRYKLLNMELSEICDTIFDRAI